MAEIILKGISWNHSRGMTPLLALAQRFSELYADVKVVWEKRSLQAFADFPIEKLAEEYDLLIVDHPWVGCAAATRCVIPLEQHLSADFLGDQAVHSVGLSHPSYNYGGHQWALAVDAATPVASYRADLMADNQQPVPTQWNEVLELAKAGRVAVPAIPIDMLMNFYTFCLAHEGKLFTNEEEIIDAETGLKALETMAEFYGLVDKSMFKRNPIAVAELMTTSDDYWYCPFAYGYSNYSRLGYAKHKLAYTDLVRFNGKLFNSTLGGTGLSVSAFSKHQPLALRFAEMAASPNCQTGFYTQNGGQPGYLKAWTDPVNNAMTEGYFTNTLPALERAYMRPRYNGYLAFQDHAGHPLHQWMEHGGSAKKLLDEMNVIYRSSIVKKLDNQLGND